MPTAGTPAVYPPSVGRKSDLATQPVVKANNTADLRARDISPTGPSRRFCHPGPSRSRTASEPFSSGTSLATRSLSAPRGASAGTRSA